MIETVCILLGVVGLVLAFTAWGLRRRTRRLDAAFAELRQKHREVHGRLTRVERRRNELEAVFASMVEGVMAIDTEQRLISLNRAAAQLLSLDPQRVVGRPIQEVVRNVALQSLVTRTLDSASAEPTTGEMTLRLSPGTSTDDRFLQVQASTVRDAEGDRVGAVLVLHDTTRLRRLENVRRDFVANVSHEIKTPISAITAAVETLLSDPDMPATPRENFTGIIARQAERLDAIVEDLLSLTRLERDGSAKVADVEPHPVEPSIRAACETCQAKASARSIVLDIDAEPVTARVVPTLLEQALINLIDNAIKYSPEHTTVNIAARRRGDEVRITVTDQGRGIEPEHLPRVFERFYRTDRARSRQLGGTGLGLSIVKHVADCLGGRAGVHSDVGRGSTFSLTFPAGPPPTAREPAACETAAEA
jgi:two-component system phosphate regulon sensor histidine kinase PhoR